MTMPNTVIAVDPGWNKGAFAIFKAGKLEATATFNVERAADILVALIMQATQVICNTEGRAVLAIETQYLGNNPQSAIKIVQARMAWEVVAVQQGYEIAQINPQTWQSRLCNIKKGIGREETGLAYERVAKMLSGIAMPRDEAAAYLIGEYYLGAEKHRLATGQ